MEKSKLILKIYQLLPEGIQNNERVIALVQPIAEKELERKKQELIKARWEKEKYKDILKECKKNCL